MFTELDDLRCVDMCPPSYRSPAEAGDDEVNRQRL